MYLRRVLQTAVTILRPVFLLIVITSIGQQLYGQIPLQLTYESSLSDTNAVSRMLLQASNGRTILFSTASSKQQVLRDTLTATGNYRFDMTFTDKQHPKDSVCAVLDVSPDVLQVDIDLSLFYSLRLTEDYKQKDSVATASLNISVCHQSPPQVSIRYLYNRDGKNSREIAGPMFAIVNNSKDTLYGEFLPGYFWGYYATLDDGKPGRYRWGPICSSWAPGTPIAPGGVGYAWIGSFGKTLLPGKYRFKVLYTPQRGGDVKPFSHTAHSVIDWHLRVKHWYVLTYDFEITGSNATAD